MRERGNIVDERQECFAWFDVRMELTNLSSRFLVVRRWDLMTAVDRAN